MKQVWQSATALGATISGCASAVQWAKALNLCSLIASIAFDCKTAAFRLPLISWRPMARGQSG